MKRARYIFDIPTTPQLLWGIPSPLLPGAGTYCDATMVWTIWCRLSRQMLSCSGMQRCACALRKYMFGIRSVVLVLTV